MPKTTPDGVLFQDGKAHIAIAAEKQTTEALTYIELLQKKKQLATRAKEIEQRLAMVNEEIEKLATIIKNFPEDQKDI